MKVDVRCSKRQELMYGIVGIGKGVFMRLRRCAGAVVAHIEQFNVTGYGVQGEPC